ncbi:MAG: hypothetical protein WD872_03320 [Pirellulaceae bacterium]
MVALWGLLFVIVLTMISGARELMTPGAWEKQGLTYKLRTEDQPAATVAELRNYHDRQQKLETLYRHLTLHAAGQAATNLNRR